jgi:two-component system KDP operon response regulator KdpE
MAGMWSLRHLFNDRSHREETDEAIVTTGTIDMGDFRIDTVHGSATLRGHDLALTPEEFEVLVFLTTHPQRFVTPRTMLATSWTRGGLHQTEFLKALLGLRKKIDALSSGKQYLRTEPWVVYRFDPNCSLAT